MEENTNGPIFIQQETEEALPLIGWTNVDTWMGIGLLIVLITAILLKARFTDLVDVAGGWTTVGTEMILLVPILFIFIWRKIPITELGFRKFDWNILGLGCGLGVLAYAIIFIHNLIMTLLGVVTQGELIYEVFDKLESPFLLFFSGILLAPLTEEMFFRGFLFQGFRQKYGWKFGLLLSSFIFGLSHLQLAALLPTFLLGCVIAYIFHRTNSILPGMLLHFLINTGGFLGAYAAYKLNLF